jgi:MFS superfamily sulfate permease-like transporter
MERLHPSRLLPGLATLRGYQRSWLRGDVMAGLTVAAYLVPQVMAYSGLAGLPPVAGLWAILAPLALYALLGSSRQLSVGPESTTALMTATVHDIDDYPQARTIPGLVVYRYDSPLFFANAEDFRRRALAAVTDQPEPVAWFVLNAEANVEVDITALDALDELRDALDARGRRVRDGQGQAGSPDPARRVRADRCHRSGPHLPDAADGRCRLRDLAQHPSINFTISMYSKEPLT